MDVCDAAALLTSGPAASLVWVMLDGGAALPWGMEEVGREVGGMAEEEMGGRSMAEGCGWPTECGGGGWPCSPCICCSR
jgi:hypothetical protein